MLQLASYKLIRADFDMGDTVLENNDVHLSKVDERTIEITSPGEGERTFRTWDFLTMLGSFVEFDTFDSNPQVRCVFENVAEARALFSALKPNPKIEVGTY